MSKEELEKILAKVWMRDWSADDASDAIWGESFDDYIELIPKTKNTINVYAIKAYGNYGGGMAIVAANNESEAKELAEKAENNLWRVRYNTPDSIDLLPLVCDGPARILTHFETGE